MEQLEENGSITYEFSVNLNHVQFINHFYQFRVSNQNKHDYVEYGSNSQGHLGYVHGFVQGFGISIKLILPHEFYF